MQLPLSLLLAALLASAPAFGATPAPAPRNAAAKVEVVDGAVTVEKPDKSRSTPKVGDTISEGDAITTGADGELQLSMQDGGYVAVRPNTRMSITRYQATGEATDTSILSLVHGGLRAVSGWIGKYNAKNYQVRSNIATVGIRGTDHETLVRLDGDADGAPGMYDRVYAGATTITSARGRIDVAPGDRVGFHPAGRGQRPRLLDRLPRFFRASRNEGLIEGRHARIQEKLESLREERRKRIRERREKRLAERDDNFEDLGDRIEERRENREERREERRENAEERRENLQEKRDAAQERRAKAKEAREARPKRKRRGDAD